MKLVYIQLYFLICCGGLRIDERVGLKIVNNDLYFTDFLIIACCWGSKNR